MTATSQVLLAFANPEQARLMRLLTTATVPLPVATLSKLLDRPQRDIRRSLRGLRRAGVIDDRGGAVARTSALDVTLGVLWLDLKRSCCSQALYARSDPLDATEG